MFLLLALGNVVTVTTYMIDHTAAARRFDGIGALSGGGTTSKLLPDYHSDIAAEILDVLFKPKHMASLQILKVEIGGDMCSTEGSEASHMHTEDDLNCERGYEWWLMKQAKSRNPSITLYGLPWGFPNWITQGNLSSNPLDAPNANRTVSYIANWVECAAKSHNLTIDYIGPWNEMDDQFASAGISYLKLLRSTLDARGLRSTKLVGGDVHSWVDPLCDAITTGSDPELKAAVAVIGKHYPSTHSDMHAVATGKPLWSTEDYASDSHKAGGRCQARIANQNWVNGNMTATIAWNLIDSYYPWLQFSNDGLMTARSPWSGHYSVDPPIAACAHTTQFTEPGMWVLRQGAGSGSLTSGGSYVGYVSSSSSSNDPGHTLLLSPSPFTLVIEKVDPQLAGCGFSGKGTYTVSDETAVFKVTDPSLFGASLAMWRSNFATMTFFQKAAADVTVGADGTFSVHVAVDDVITLSTIAGATNGNSTLTPAPDAPFPTQHTETFQSYPVGQEAQYFAQVSGAFEVAIADGNTETDGSANTNKDIAASGSATAANKVLKQTAVGMPVKWLRGNVMPATQLGDPNWSATNVSVALNPGSSGGGNAAFVGLQMSLSSTDGGGLLLAVNDSHWWLAACKLSQLANPSGSALLASGTLPPSATAAKDSKRTKAAARKDGISSNEWRQVQVESNPGASTLTVTIDGTAVVAKQGAGWPSLPHKGTVALGSTLYALAMYDDFAVSAVASSSPPSPGPSPGPPPSPAPPLPNPTGCAPPAAGQSVKLWSCAPSNTKGQQWEFNSGGKVALRASPDLCLAPMPRGTGVQSAAPGELDSRRGAAISGVAAASACSGPCIALASCSTAPQWNYTGSDGGANARITLASSALGGTRSAGGGSQAQQCLDVDGKRETQGAAHHMDLYPCNSKFDGGANEQFGYDPATGQLDNAMYSSMTSCVAVCGDK